MADRRLYLDDATLETVETTVVERGEVDGHPWVRLAETVFHPEGGGQPPDRGTIGGIEVLDVQERGGHVVHVLAAAVDAGSVTACIDVARRRDLCQQHTAQHLLSAILADRHARPTTAFHLGEAYTAVEVGGPPPPADRLAAWEEEVNAAVRLDPRVTTAWIAPGDLERPGVRSRGLPEGHTGAVRIVEIEGLDRCACGGTHVDRLAEIQLVHLLDAEPARGGTRIRFLAGGRVAVELRRLEAAELALKLRLGTGPAEFLGVLDTRDAERRALERRVDEMETAWADAVASTWSAAPGPRIFRHVPAASAGMLRRLAARVLAGRPDLTVILVGGTSGPPALCFLVQAGPEGPEDVAPVAARVREILGAKGGGRGRLHQGTGGVWPGEGRFDEML